MVRVFRNIFYVLPNGYGGVLPYPDEDPGKLGERYLFSSNSGVLLSILGTGTQQ